MKSPRPSSRSLVKTLLLVYPLVLITGDTRVYTVAVYALLLATYTAALVGFFFTLYRGLRRISILLKRR